MIDQLKVYSATEQVSFSLFLLFYFWFILFHNRKFHVLVMLWDFQHIIFYRRNHWTIIIKCNNCSKLILLCVFLRLIHLYSLSVFIFQEILIKVISGPVKPFFSFPQSVYYNIFLVHWLWFPIVKLLNKYFSFVFLKLFAFLLVVIVYIHKLATVYHCRNSFTIHFHLFIFVNRFIFIICVIVFLQCCEGSKTFCRFTAHKVIVNDCCFIFLFVCWSSIWMKTFSLWFLIFEFIKAVFRVNFLISRIVTTIIWWKHIWDFGLHKILHIFHFYKLYTLFF